MTKKKEERWKSSMALLQKMEKLKKKEASPEGKQRSLTKNVLLLWRWPKLTQDDVQQIVWIRSDCLLVFQEELQAERKQAR